MFFFATIRKYVSVFQNSLINSPETFNVDHLDWQVRLGWKEEEEAAEGRYVVWVNDIRTDELPVFEWEEPTHDLMRSSVNTKMTSSGPRLEMRFALLIKEIPECLIVYHNKIHRFTQVSLGKFSASSYRKRLKVEDEGLWPMTLICEIRGISLNISVTYNKKKNEYDVTINNQSWDMLPYRATTYSKFKHIFVSSVLPIIFIQIPILPTRSFLKPRYP